MVRNEGENAIFDITRYHVYIYYRSFLLRNTACTWNKFTFLEDVAIFHACNEWVSCGPSVILVLSGTLCLFVKLLVKMATIIRLVRQPQLLLNQSNQAKSGIEIVTFCCNCCSITLTLCIILAELKMDHVDMLLYLLILDVPNWFGSLTVI